MEESKVLLAAALALGMGVRSVEAVAVDLLIGGVGSQEWRRPRGRRPRRGRTLPEGCGLRNGRGPVASSPENRGGRPPEGGSERRSKREGFATP